MIRNRLRASYLQGRNNNIIARQFNWWVQSDISRILSLQLAYDGFYLGLYGLKEIQIDVYVVFVNHQVRLVKSRLFLV